LQLQLPVDVLVVPLPHLRTVDGVGEHEPLHQLRMVERERLRNHTPVGESVDVHRAEAEGAHQPSDVCHVPGERDGPGILDRLRPTAPPIIEIDDTMTFGQCAEHRVEDDV
jgi:hypothetical protein